MKSDFFSQKNKDFLNYFFWMKSIKKKTGANFLLFVANCGKILFYILILIYFFKYETIVRFDVYACLDCNCWKRITVLLKWHHAIAQTPISMQLLDKQAPFKMKIPTKNKYIQM